MKAFLLAAGIGSRLRPLTDKLPKCLVPLNGKPLLYYWLKLFERYHVDQVLINLHHMPEKVSEFVKQNKFEVEINLFYEERLLGSAGTVKACHHFIENDDIFLVCYADNLTNINLGRLIDFHGSTNPLLTLAIFKAEKPRQCGIIVLDEQNTIIDFEEKPKCPKTNLAAAGIYITTPEIINYIPEKIPCDFGFDVLPQLIGSMKGYLIDEYFIDIGTIENYERAKREWNTMTAYNMRNLNEEVNYDYIPDTIEN